MKDTVISLWLCLVLWAKILASVGSVRSGPVSLRGSNGTKLVCQSQATEVIPIISQRQDLRFWPPCIFLFQILKVDMGCQDNKDIGGLHSRHVKWPVNTTVLPSYLAKLTSGTAHLLTKHYEDPATVSLDQRHCYGGLHWPVLQGHLAKR